MGAQWKNANKSENAARKGAIVHKIVKEITVSARIGDPDPNNNPRLRAALEVARKNSVSRDTIDRAIKRGAGTGDDSVQYDLVTYEGFTPHKVPIIVECLTDNKTRTAAEIRGLFKKAQLGSIGSVTWMFDRVGVVEATINEPKIDTEEVAIEAGAQKVESLEKSEIENSSATGARFFCDPSDLDAVSTFLSQNKWVVSQSELSYIAKNTVDLNPEQKKEVVEFLGDINDNDDVHRIYVALGS